MKTASFMLLPIALVMAACTKEIELEYDESGARLVVEATVSQGNGPHEVRLSRSVDFTQSNIFPVVSDAIVTIVDDQGDDETLVHQGGGVYRSNGLLTGTVGHTYTLTIQLDGMITTATSTMPMAVELDTLEVDELGIFGTENKVIVPRYNDPAGVENFYRLRGYTNGNPWSAIFTRDDKVSDGQTNGQPVFTNEEELRTGDTVRVDLFCIDPGVHLYWFSLEQNTSGGPNSSAAPADPTSNLSGNVLGYFSAQYRTTRSVVIP